MSIEPNNPRPRQPAPRTGAARPVNPGQAGDFGHRTATLRRTIIPVLITLALLLPSLGIWFQRADIDSPFRDLPPMTVPALFTGGAVAAILAALNMRTAKKGIARR